MDEGVEGGIYSGTNLYTTRSTQRVQSLWVPSALERLVPALRLEFERMHSPSERLQA